MINKSSTQAHGCCAAASCRQLSAGLHTESNCSSVLPNTPQFTVKTKGSLLQQDCGMVLHFTEWFYCWWGISSSQTDLLLCFIPSWIRTKYRFNKEGYFGLSVFNVITKDCMEMLYQPNLEQLFLLLLTGMFKFLYLVFIFRLLLAYFGINHNDISNTLMDEKRIAFGRSSTKKSQNHGVKYKKLEKQKTGILKNRDCPMCGWHLSYCLMLIDEVKNVHKENM